MNKMKLPPEIQFHQDIPLLVYRPRGLIGEVALNNVISVIEELEAATQEPFYRFFDTLSAHEVELNFKYIIQVSLHRHLAYAGRPPLKSAILATDATTLHRKRQRAYHSRRPILRCTASRRQRAGQGDGPCYCLLYKQSSRATLLLRKANEK
jgi:hypothetical protein